MGCCCGAAKDLVDKKFDESEIKLRDNNANNSGIKSLGTGQCKGNGILLVTDHVLFFVQYCCGQEEGIEIPLDKVMNIKSEATWLGRTQLGMKHLVIEYKDANGDDDAIGLLVKDLKTWMEFLQELSDRPNTALFD